MWSAGRGWNKGFTLIELVVVLSILGLATALTVPVFSRTLDVVKLNGAAQDTASFMRYARGQAVYRQEQRLVALDMEQNLYRLGDDEMASGGEHGRYVLPAGMEIKEFRWLDGSPETVTGFIEFYPSGGSSGGSLTIEGTAGEARIVLEPFTGLPVVEIKRSYEQ